MLSVFFSLAPDSKWLNPHRSSLGIGNFDVNVLMAALAQKQCEAEWFDKRKWVVLHNTTSYNYIFGFCLFLKRPFYHRLRRVTCGVHFERKVEDGSCFLHSTHRLQPLDRRHSCQRPLLQPRFQTQTSRSHRQRRWRQNVFSRKADGRWQRTVCDQVGDQTIYIICSCLARLRLRLEKVFQKIELRYFPDLANAFTCSFTV